MKPKFGPCSLTNYRKLIAFVRGGRGFFPAGTMVMTPFGHTEISCLRTGDKVKVYDSKKGALLERTGLKVLGYRGRRSPLLTLADGTSLRLTPNHNILVEGKWVRASAVQAGATIAALTPLWNIKGAPRHMLGNIKVVNIEDGGNCHAVYNPIVEDSLSHCRWRHHAQFRSV